MRSNFERLRIILIPAIAIVVIAAWLGFAGDTPRAEVRRGLQKFSADERFFISDAVTSESRKMSNDLISVPVMTESDRKRASRLGTVAQDFGSFLIMYGDSARSASSYGEGAQKIDTTINLPGAVFDPINDPPAETVRAGSTRFGKGYYVVQLSGIATDEVLDSLRGLGLEVLQYVPNNAFFVYGDGEAAVRAAEHSRVRWVGEYTADQKRSPDVNGFAAAAKRGTVMFNIAVFNRADLDEVTKQILADTGARLITSMELQANFFNVVRIETSADNIGKIASISDVVRVDPYAFPVAEDERAAQIVAGNYTNSTTIAAPGYNPLSQFGVDGTGVTVAVSDDGVSIPGNGGFYLTASNTVDGPLHGSTAGATTGHGHLNASIIAGTSPFGNLDPLNYNYGLGVAPKANIVNIPFLKAGYTGSDANGVDDALITSGPNGVKASISNNSWGAGTNGNVYESFAATYDGFARDASLAGTVDPLLLVFSAGNNGASGLTRPKMGKNLIATGSSENLRTELSATADNLDDISSFSARGPAADTRIKPDISAPGQTISGSRAGTDCTGVTSCFETNHSWSSGTSHSAPQIAGVAALFTQFWKSGHAGVNPSPAITKAAILQSGQEMTGTTTPATVPNGVEGWGRVNMKFILNTGVAMKYVDQTVNFSNPADQIVYTGTIADGSKPFRATLVWTDPPGVGDPALVNNLDLSVTINNSATYLGNAFSGGQSITGGSADTRNNVEQVWRTGTATNTPVTVTIKATALNGDGILGNADLTDQHFALVLYNFVDAAPTVFNISGRVVSGAGRPINGARIALFNGPTQVATVQTNSFGYYRFVSVPGSTTYSVVATAKRYTFNPQPAILGSANLDGVDITSTSGAP